jgi:ATP-dependent Clp protease adaptor protein ClpS
MIQPKTLEKTQVEEIISQPYVLILCNDDYNTFDWVITCLIKICGHESTQAENCAMIVHYKGKCDVKYGSKEEIEKMKEQLKSAGLSVKMEKN